MKFKPTHNHVIIKQDDNSEQKVGNIIIPDAGSEKPRIGTVLAMGPGMITITGTLIPCQVKEGDKVAFPSFGGTKMSINGEEYVIMKDQDILTVIEEETNSPEFGEDDY